jgi:hypothetical protein
VREIEREIEKEREREREREKKHARESESERERPSWEYNPRGCEGARRQLVWLVCGWGAGGGAETCGSSEVYVRVLPPVPL